MFCVCMNVITRMHGFPENVKYVNAYRCLWLALRKQDYAVAIGNIFYTYSYPQWVASEWAEIID